ncbi:hypothetical protein [Kingella potus]|nr:hypothetical protein [Kingella potus]
MCTLFGRTRGLYSGKDVLSASIQRPSETGFSDGLCRSVGCAA